MRLNLQDLAKKAEKTQIELDIQERLPSHLTLPCHVSASLTVKRQDDYFLLALESSASLNVICQRCSEQFQTDWKNYTELAICDNDARAEALLPIYECMVSADKAEPDLESIITDELHLYSPQFHPDMESCDKIVHRYIS